MKKKQFTEITKWQKKTFGQATPLSKIAHLKEEVEELEQAVYKNENVSSTLMEFADCFILLFGAASSYGMDYEHICEAIEAKMKINRVRKWGVQKENGVVNHIK